MPATAPSARRWAAFGVVALALTAGSTALIAFSLFPSTSPTIGDWDRGDFETTRRRARHVLSATEMYQHEVGGCPTVADLVGERLLRAGSATDTYGVEFLIECSDRSVSVTSAGPDRVHHTEDDVVSGSGP